MRRTGLFLILACICLVLMVMPAFAGGGGQKTQSGKTSLLYWIPPFASGDTLDKEFWTKALTPWRTQNNIDVTVDIVPWDQLIEKYMAGFSSGTGADVVYDGGAENIPLFVSMGVCEPLEQYFSKEEQDNYIYWNSGNYQGKQYALPYVVGNARVFYFNMDLVRKAGVNTLPKTWNEFIDFGKKITAANLGPDVITFAQEWAASTWADSGIITNFLGYYWQAGGNMYSHDGSRITLSEGDAALRTAQFLYDLMHVHGITSKESYSIGDSEKHRLFLEGKIVCCVSATSFAQQLDEAGINWDFVDTLMDKTGATWVAGDSLFINSASKNKQAAAGLMKFVSSPQVMEPFHKELASFPPITKREAYTDNARFKNMYENSKYLRMDTGSTVHSPLVSNLFGNLQLMMLGQISPREAINRTVEYSKTLDL